ncbi:MAG TPA: FAD-binding protein [Candidatus Dormibacteraeota bacterium]|nr:FAD-binding protein [Candidatus Dormibacteraeota bacterium]
MTGQRPPDPAIASLRRQIGGEVAAPGDESYQRICRSWNSTASIRPALAVAAASAEDVARTVAFAAEHGRRVSVQATGHGASGEIGEDVVLIGTAGLDTVEIDPDRRVARIGAGATWGAVTAAAQRSGLAGLAGTAPDVGATGNALYGGVGWLARAHGMGSASLLAADYVDAEGRPRHTDEDEDPDALWAFRGGAGVGIATAVELRLWPHARLHGGAGYWPLEQAPALIDRWLSWTDGLTPSITSLVWAFPAPDAPAFPTSIRGRDVIALGACADDAGGRAALDLLLRQLPEPLLDTFADRSPSELGEIQSGPPGPVPSRGEGRLLRRLDTGTAMAVLDASGVGRGGPLIFVELRHLGGRAAKRGAEGALTSLPGEFLLDAVGAAPDAGRMAAIDAVLADVVRAAGPADTGRSLAGFRGGHTDAPGALEPADLERLRALCARRDPAGRILRPRELAPARTGVR